MLKSVEKSTQPYGCFKADLPPAPPGGTLNYGVMGSVASIPAGWSSKVIMSAGGAPGASVRSWGAKLMKFFGKQADISQNDFITNHLGYDTDNGAYYYYNPEKGKSYEDTVKNI